MDEKEIETTETAEEVVEGGSPSSESEEVENPETVDEPENVA